jgi:hypothetical protein
MEPSNIEVNPKPIFTALVWLAKEVGTPGDSKTNKIVLKMADLILKWLTPRNSLPMQLPQVVKNSVT